MTDDPVKLYVIVMVILLLVLSVVAYQTYDESHAYEAALQRAPREAKDLREFAADVNRLVDQVARSKIGNGEFALVDQVARELGIDHNGIKNDDARVPGSSGRELRLILSFGSGKSPPLPRDRIAQFCARVEEWSQGILKTIELELTRYPNRDAAGPGEADIVTGDVYSGRVVFGKRYIPDR